MSRPDAWPLADTARLRERLARKRGQTRAVPLREELAAIRHWAAPLPVRDGRTPDQIIGYDARGLPG